MNIAERLKAVRKELHLTQQAFADRLGVKQNTVASYEMGRSGLSDVTITAIVREFNVNEAWLRTGEGEMFLPLSNKEKIAVAFAKFVKHMPPEFIDALADATAGFSEEQWQNMADLAETLVKNLKK